MLLVAAAVHARYTSPPKDTKICLLKNIHGSGNTTQFAGRISEILQLVLDLLFVVYKSLTSVKDAATWDNCLLCSSLSEDWATCWLIFWESATVPSSTPLEFESLGDTL